MDKKKKIIICVFGIAVGFLLIFGTVYNAKNNLQTNTNVNFMNNTSDTNMRGNRPNDGTNSQMTPPDKNNDSSNDSTDSETNDNTMTPKDNNQRGMTPGSNLQTNFKQISNSLTISSIILVSLGTLLIHSISSRTRLTMFLVSLIKRYGRSNIFRLSPRYNFLSSNFAETLFFKKLYNDGKCSPSSSNASRPFDALLRNCVYIFW